MPPPPSYIDITPVPFSRVVTQAEFNGGTFGGVANEVWFRFIATEPIALGTFTNRGGTFVPTTSVFESDGSTLVGTIAPLVGNARSGYEILPIAGTYYVRVRRLPAGASDFDFTTLFDTKPVDVLDYVEGDFIDNNDGSGLPAALMDMTGAIKSFITAIPAGEVGAILPTNESIWYDNFGTASAAGTLAIFDALLQYVVSTTLLIDPDFAIARTTVALGGTVFYVLDPLTGGVYTVSPTTGVATLIATIAAPANPFRNPSAIGVNVAGTLLYWTEYKGNASIHRHDLVTDTPVGDLYTIPSYDLVNDRLGETVQSNPGDILVLADDTVVTWWFDQSVSRYKILHISPGGVLIAELTLAAGINIDHVAYIADATDAVYIWVFTTGIQIGSFGQIDLTTGVISPQTPSIIFFSGNINATVNNATLFSPSNSCTFLRLSAFTPPPGCPGLVTAPRIDGLPYVPFSP